MTSYQRKFEQMFEVRGEKETTPSDTGQTQEVTTEVKYFGDSTTRPIAEALLPRIERTLGSIA